MKDIIFIVALALLALLGIILIVDILLKNGKTGGSKKKPHSKGQKSAAPFHSGTVLMDNASFGNESRNVPLDYGSNVRKGTLRHYGVGDWPREIPVQLSLGDTFTIGRFDVSLGHKISDFEFAAESKAVSRRHAVLSRDNEGFMIQDLGSKAGTSVNGVRLEPHSYYRLMDGFTVSFGTAGADYFWKECSNLPGT